MIPSQLKALPTEKMRNQWSSSSRNSSYQGLSIWKANTTWALGGAARPAASLRLWERRRLRVLDPLLWRHSGTANVSHDQPGGCSSALLHMAPQAVSLSASHRLIIVIYLRRDTTVDWRTIIWHLVFLYSFPKYYLIWFSNWSWKPTISSSVSTLHSFTYLWRIFHYIKANK